MRLLKFSLLRIRILVALAAGCVIFTVAFIAHLHRQREPLPIFEDALDIFDRHTDYVNDFLQSRENADTSVLGDVLFKDYPFPPQKNKFFQVLLWRCGPFLENRHIKRFSNIRFDPFEGCSVNNCRITYEESDLLSSDAVMFHLHRLKGLKDLPNLKSARPENQRWIFMTDESPYHTFMMSTLHWSNYSGIFNWSMSYKMESDIPVPYGRTVPLENPIIGVDIEQLLPFADKKQRNVLVAACISNCGSQNERLTYIKELQKYIDVDLYGRCGTKFKNTCPRGFNADCPSLRNYYFYLSFENSNCDQYISEKVYWNAFHNGAVPVIMGSVNVTCKKILPPNSYIHVFNYARPLDLARHLIYINNTWNSKFFRYHRWRQHFLALNEHGYFGSKSYHYCRICEALNYNDLSPKVYDNLTSFLSIEANCKP